MNKHNLLLFLFATGLLFSVSCQRGYNDSKNDGKDYQDLKITDEVFYHMFQRSFYDSNGDGHGDLNGVSEKIDYLKELGVTSVLMTPLYKSIYYHNYFPDDFKAIDEKYGTEVEYIQMVENLHQNGLKFYMDMEIQYATINHEWFSSSFNNPESGYSDHVLYNGLGNTEPETMIFNLTGLESYLGDSLDITSINLDNELVKEYFKDLFTYWLDPNYDGDFSDGVDGFRIDHMMDDLDYKGKLTNLLSDFWRPLISELKSINPNIKIIAEQSNWNDLGSDYFEKSDVDLMFAFAVRNAIVSFDREVIINRIDTLSQVTPENKNQLFFLENHDIDRYASVIDDPAKLRIGAVLTMLSDGVPLVYYGQELGMKGIGGFGLYGNSDANDIPRREAFEWYSEIEGEGMPLWYKGTGSWWDNSYLKSNDGISYEEQKDDPNSLFNLYKDLIDLRRDNEAFKTGKRSFFRLNDRGGFAMLRMDSQDAFLVFLNTDISEAKMTLNLEDFKLEKGNNKLKFLIGDASENMICVGNNCELILPSLGFNVWKIE